MTQPSHSGPYDPTRPASPYGAPRRIDGEERTMMLLAHLSAPAAYLLSVGWVPFLGPLLVWMFYKDKSAAVRTAAAGAFNFNVTMTIATLVTWISVFITLGIGLIWAIPILIVLFVIQVWVHVRAVLKALGGEVYEYPFQIRILS